MTHDNPILNNPYQKSQRHYATLDGELDYSQVRKGRRIFDPNTLGQSMPVRQKKRIYLKSMIMPNIIKRI